MTSKTDTSKRVTFTILTEKAGAKTKVEDSLLFLKLIVRKMN